MAKHGELEVRSRSGKVARSVFAVLLILPMLATPSFARPARQAAHPPPIRPRMENNQQPHLGTWLERHSNLSPQEQEKALQNEPGFGQLPPETQQRLLSRLQQLNRMPPAQRQRMVDRIEVMERMSPEMRQEVRSSVQQFHTLPTDRQRMMKKAFRDLREYPPEQRQAMMNSAQFQAQFSPQERGILGNMLTMEPYRPANGAGLSDGPQYGH
ncbi:MAG: DUF3106 domain-containing protein [Acidobacteriaceae bacterium]